MAKQANWDSIASAEPQAGVRRQVFSGENIMMARFEIQKSSSLATHKHPHDQLTYLLQGKIRFIIGDKEIILKAGDVLHVPPNIEHGSQVLGEIPAVILDVFSPIREEFLLPEDTKNDA